jgi:hypothetical protein
VPARHFFFASYEGFRQREDLVANQTLPNAALMELIPGFVARIPDLVDRDHLSADCIGCADRNYLDVEVSTARFIKPERPAWTATGGAQA